MSSWRTQVARVDRNRAATTAAYDRLSRSYDTLVGRFEARYRDAGLALLDVQPGERVLEIGCATGHALAALARRVGARGSVSGVDISPRMVDIARARAPSATVDVGDATALSFAARTFDAAFCSFTLELFAVDDIPLVLAELRRVLVPGGRLGVVALALEVSLATRVYLAAHALAPSVVDCRPIPTQEILVDAGFTIARAQRQRMWALPIDVVVANSG